MAGTTPRWRQIADDLSKRIEAEEDGALLPTELDLQDLYGASRNTVRNAVKWLAGRDLVYSQRGRGTFVKKLDPFVTKIGGEPDPGFEERTMISVARSGEDHDPDVSDPRIEIRPATRVVAAELGLPQGESPIGRLQEWLVGDEALLLQTTYYPMRFLELGANRLVLPVNIDEGAVHYLENLLGFKEAGRRDRFIVRAPDHDEARFFGVPEDGRALIQVLIRTGFNDVGEPFRVTVTVSPTDRNQIVIEHGKVPPAKNRAGSCTA